MARFVVYADMVGDLFHAGHVSFLRKVRDLATSRANGREIWFVVGLMGDEDAAGYKRQPVNTLAERIEVVRACRYVDDVVAGCPTPVDDAFLDAHAVDLVVHGDDFDDAATARWYGAPLARGIFATVAYTQDASTTDTIDRVRRHGQ